MAVERVETTESLNPSSGTGTYQVSVSAPTGKKVMGGGYRVLNSGDTSSSTASALEILGSWTNPLCSIWVVEARNPNAGAVDLHVYAICDSEG